MGKNFVRFKRKALTICLVKSVLLGLAVGALLAGGLLLLSNFEILQLKPIASLLIGLGGALSAGTGGYFLLRISDKKLARRLDEEFALQEKVQTMLAYKSEEGTMYRLQREDANAAVASVSKKRLKWKRLWIYIVCACIGAGALVSGFLIKPKEETPPPPPPPTAFELTDIQAAAMEELILYVQNSAMQSPYKENVATSLQSLLDELKLATTVEERDVALEKAIDEIYEQTDDSSTAVELMDALWMGAADSSSVKRLAEALNYYDWTKADEWASFSEEMTSFRSSFIHADTVTENPDEEKMALETGELLGGMEFHITNALTRAGVSSEDGVYEQLLRFAQAQESYKEGGHLYGFTPLSQLAESLGYQTLQKELDATFSAISAELFRGLEQHAANTGTGEYAMTKLKELFGYALPKFERPNFYETSGDDSSTGGEDGSPTKPVTPGDTVYGSNELVLDPMTNTYVEYGTILDKYYSLMFGKVQDGNYSEEEKEAMQKYFEILYGESKKEGED